MTFKKYIVRGLCMGVIAAVVAGCSTSGQRAQVQERGAKKSKAGAKTSKSVPRDKDWRPQIYVVQKGDTLYSIAFNHGLDYHEIVELNNLKNPSLIQIGQEIRLFPAGVAGAVSPPPDGKPVAATAPQDAPPQSEPSIMNQPLAIKLAYSEQAAAQIEKIQKGTAISVPPATNQVETKPESKPVASNDTATDDDEDVSEWGMPTVGKLIGEFSESANRKGIDIAGKLGQPVVASAAGKVVYSGNGLRGYGRLVIIKHNKTYLSAYAHNNYVLVKEGQSVNKGQKIAEMGKTDADQVKLHFEIRKLGKPVDPAKHLPL